MSNRKVLIGTTLKPKIERNYFDVNSKTPYSVKNDEWGYIDKDLWYKVQLFQSTFPNRNGGVEEGISKLALYYTSGHTHPDGFFREGELEELKVKYKGQVERYEYLTRNDPNSYFSSLYVSHIPISRPKLLREKGKSTVSSSLGSRAKTLEEKIYEDILDIYRLRLKARFMNIWFKLSYPLRREKQKKQLKKLWESLRIGYIPNSLKTDFFITLKEFYELQHWIENVIVQIHREKEGRILEFLYEEVAKRIKY